MRQFCHIYVAVRDSEMCSITKHFHAMFVFIVILPSRSSGVRVYIDPTTYQDVEEAVQEFANELDRCWVELEALIGGGMLFILL